jgi:hypothetical protein
MKLFIILKYCLDVLASPYWHGWLLDNYNVFISFVILEKSSDSSNARINVGNVQTAAFTQSLRFSWCIYSNKNDVTLIKSLINVRCKEQVLIQRLSNYLWKSTFINGNLKWLPFLDDSFVDIVNNELNYLFPIIIPRLKGTTGPSQPLSDLQHTLRQSRLFWILNFTLIIRICKGNFS